MKRKVKSQSDLDSLPGNKKNTSKPKMPAKAVKSENPKQERPEAGDKLIAEAIDKQSKSMLLLMNSLHQQMQTIQMSQSTLITEWNFDVKRDSNGRMLKINAKAVSSNGVH